MLIGVPILRSCYLNKFHYSKPIINTEPIHIYTVIHNNMPLLFITQTGNPKEHELFI